MLVEKYYQRLTMDFSTNKRLCDEVAVIQTKRLRNQIAGFTTVSLVLSVLIHFNFQRSWSSSTAINIALRLDVNLAFFASNTN